MVGMSRRVFTNNSMILSDVAVIFSIFSKFSGPLQEDAERQGSCQQRRWQGRAVRKLNQERAEPLEN